MSRRYERRRVPASAKSAVADGGIWSARGGGIGAVGAVGVAGICPLVKGPCLLFLAKMFHFSS